MRRDAEKGVPPKTAIEIWHSTLLLRSLSLLDVFSVTCHTSESEVQIIKGGYLVPTSGFAPLALGFGNLDVFFNWPNRESRTIE